MIVSISPHTVSVIGWSALVFGLALVALLYGVGWYRGLPYLRIRLYSIPIEFLAFTIFAWSINSSSGIPAYLMGFGCTLALEAFCAVDNTLRSKVERRTVNRIHRQKRPPG